MTPPRRGTPEWESMIAGELEVAMDRVAGYFDSKEKALLWFRTPNYLLGNVSPRDLIRLGRGHKLLAFIDEALEDDNR